MNDFNVIAAFYDSLFAEDGVKWAEKLVSAVKKYAPSPEGIDVGAGTGYFTRALAAAGFDVTGVEPSVAMLNAAIAAGGADYVKGDIRRLKGFVNLGFVTAINDVINYIKPADLPRAFASVAACLRPGGIFLFDYSSEERLKNTIGENLFGEDGEDLSYMWFNTLRKNGVKMDLTFFVRREDGLYERREESFTEYFHDGEDVRKALTEAGFSEIARNKGERVKIVALRR